MMTSRINWSDIFTYNEHTGRLHWKIRSGQRIRVGDVAGCKHHTGYWIIRYQNKNYLAHRLTWLMHNDGIVISDFEEIDHIDHDRINNRISNLRKVSRTLNCQNKSLSSNNVSGTSGVSWYSAYQKWRANIVVNGKLVFLGNFERKEDAVAARIKADIKYGFHENHGK